MLEVPREEVLTSNCSTLAVDLDDAIAWNIFKANSLLYSAISGTLRIVQRRRS